MKAKHKRKRSVIAPHQKWTAVRIKKLREKILLTQRELAVYLGYRHFARVLELESGARPLGHAQGLLLDVLEAAAMAADATITLTDRTSIRVSAVLVDDTAIRSSVLAKDRRGMGQCH